MRKDHSWQPARVVALVLIASPLVACGTLGAPAASDAAPPSAGVGPFRALEKGEDLASAPTVLDGVGAPFTEPSALPVDPADAGSMGVYLYAVSSPENPGESPNVIVRTRADDGRSFYGTVTDDLKHPAVVLSPSLAWEGANLAGPSALRVGSQIYLYYAAAGGIGLAHSSDGMTFVKEAAPVLTPDTSVRWETTVPFAPSVAVLPDGSYDMMYAAGVSIGEAVSTDGVHFTRVDADPSTPTFDPVLSPLGGAAPRDGGDLDAGEAGADLPFDMTQVSDPCVLPTTSPAGRFILRILYTGYDGAPTSKTRSSAIGLAARFGTSGVLVRQSQPAFSISKHEAAPTLFAWSGGQMLYVQANAGGGLFEFALPGHRGGCRAHRDHVPDADRLRVFAVISRMGSALIGHLVKRGMANVNATSASVLALSMALSACSSNASAPAHAAEAGVDAHVGLDAKAHDAHASPDVKGPTDAGADVDAAINPSSWDQTYTRPSDEAGTAARAACTYKRGDMPAQTLGPSTELDKDIPISHVVVLIQENHSFDTYLGHLLQYETANGIVPAPDGKIESAPDTATNPDVPRRASRRGRHLRVTSLRARPAAL